MLNKYIALWIFWSIIVAKYFNLYAASDLPVFNSFEGLMMGDAFTAVADDDTTLFYNPAALIRHRGFSVTPVHVQMELSDVTIKSVSLRNLKLELDKRYKAFPREAEQIVDYLLGDTIFLGVGGHMNFKIGKFAISPIFNHQSYIGLYDANMPTLRIGHAYDRGVALGYAFSLTRNRSLNKFQQGRLTSLGVGVKYLKRDAIQKDIFIYGTEFLNILASREGRKHRDIAEDLGISKGEGKGIDIGLESSYSRGESLTSFGIVWQNVGDLKFKDNSDKVVSRIDSAINIGAAFSKRYFLYEYTFALDYRDNSNFKDIHMRDIRLGGRLKLPFFNIYLGLSEGYAAWGLQTKMLLFNINLGFYGVERGHNYRQEKEKRMIFSINLIQGSFEKLGIPL